MICKKNIVTNLTWKLKTREEKFQRKVAFVEIIKFAIMHQYWLIKAKIIFLPIVDKLKKIWEAGVRRCSVKNFPLNTSQKPIEKHPCGNIPSKLRHAKITLFWPTYSPPSRFITNNHKTPLTLRHAWHRYPPLSFISLFWNWNKK